MVYSIRKEAGESIKSSVSHTWTLDTRDNKINTTRGYYLKTYHEYAGLGGQAAFYKSEIEGQLARPLFSGTVRFRSCTQSLCDLRFAFQTISFTARSGLLWNLGHRSYLSDRFQLGGPTSVRAFKNNSLGPRDGGKLIYNSCYLDF
jgi:outer membrane protein insertion porin family